MKIFFATLDWLVSFFSRGINALVFGNSWHRTLSAESHFQANMVGGKWIKRRDRIDWLFSFFESGHCEKAWSQEVYRANRTYEMDRQLNE